MLICFTVYDLLNMYFELEALMIGIYIFKERSIICTKYSSCQDIIEKELILHTRKDCKKLLYIIHVKNKKNIELNSFRLKSNSKIHQIYVTNF